jgi:hypothetical protein
MKLTVSDGKKFKVLLVRLTHPALGTGGRRFESWHLDIIRKPLS